MILKIFYGTTLMIPMFYDTTNDPKNVLWYHPNDTDVLWHHKLPMFYVFFGFFFFLAPDVAKEVNLDPTLSSSRWTDYVLQYTDRLYRRIVSLDFG